MLPDVAGDPTPSDVTDRLTHRSAMRWLIVIVLLAFGLRWAGIGLDLWLDELSSLTKVRQSTPADLLLSYTSANQHVLNSLSIWAMRTLFGEEEWALRLPALVLGVAAVPAMYWLARVARFERGLALLAALLLAVSYHHIWFSQNARGYTGYVCFSLLSTAAFVTLLRSPARRWLVVFAAATGLNFVALLPAAFVFAAQAIGGMVHLGVSRRRGARDAMVERRVMVALGVGVAAGLAIYAPIVLEMVRVLSRTAPNQVTAMVLPSLAFLREVALGALPGSKGVILPVVLVTLVSGVWGLVRLAWRAPLVVGILLGSQVLFAAIILVLSWPVYPRLFLLGLALVLLVAVQLASDLGTRLSAHHPARRAPLQLLIGTALVAGSVAMLPPLFTTPKQPFRAALDEAIRRTKDGDVIVAAGVAEVGIGHYAARLTDTSASRVRRVRDVGEFHAAVGDRSPDRVVVITTLDHALRVESPELWAVITADWQRTTVMPGTVRRGSLNLWEAHPQ